jgi:hypothetical protein
MPGAARQQGFDERAKRTGRGTVLEEKMDNPNQMI